MCAVTRILQHPLITGWIRLETEEVSAEKATTWTYVGILHRWHHSRFGEWCQSKLEPTSGGFVIVSPKLEA